MAVRVHFIFIGSWAGIEDFFHKSENLFIQIEILMSFEVFCQAVKGMGTIILVISVRFPN